MSGNDIKSIFAIVDAQGFTGFDGQFMVRELSFENDLISKTFYFHTNIMDDGSEMKSMTHSDYTTWKRTIWFQKYKIHGLSYVSNKQEDMPPMMLIPVIKLLREIFAIDNMQKFGVRNTQLAAILRRYKIPHIDLTIQAVSSEIAPFWGEIRPCDNHEIYFPGMKCSAQKVSAIWNWIKMKKSLLDFKNKLKL